MFWSGLSLAKYNWLTRLVPAPILCLRSPCSPGTESWPALPWSCHDDIIFFLFKHQLGLLPMSTLGGWSWRIVPIGLPSGPLHSSGKGANSWGRDNGAWVGPTWDAVTALLLPSFWAAIEWLTSLGFSFLFCEWGQLPLLHWAPVKIRGVMCVCLKCCVKCLAQ